MPHRSYKKLLERLGALYHNGFVDRPRAQLDYYSTAGSAPIVYALGNRGALVLAEHDGMDRAQVDWTWKNRSVGRPFIEHTLLTADVMVAAERAAATHPDVKLMEAKHILAGAPESTRNAANPFKLKTRTTYDGKVLDLSVIPDAVFGLDFTVERKRKYFFLEADRATMPIMRAGLNQTSYSPQAPRVSRRRRQGQHLRCAFRHRQLSRAHGDDQSRAHRDDDRGPQGIDAWRRLVSNSCSSIGQRSPPVPICCRSYGSPAKASLVTLGD